MVIHYFTEDDAERVKGVVITSYENTRVHDDLQRLHASILAALLDDGLPRETAEAVTPSVIGILGRAFQM